MRWLGVVALAACGRIGFDPGIDATPIDARAPAVVQTGAGRILTGFSTLDVPIEPVDLEHSFLTFSLSVVYETPDDIKVTGRFLAPDRIQLTRSGTERGVDVVWTVVTWEGMTVRHGVRSFAGSRTLTAAIDPPVDVARSFVLATHRDQGTTFGDDEYIDVELTAPDTLVAQSTIQNSVSPTLAWQVVELAEGAVHHGRTTIDAVTTLREVVTPAFDPARAWIVYTHSASGNAPIEAQHQTVAARIVDGTRIAFERAGGSGTAHISWSVVELGAGEVQRAVATFADGEAMQTVPISSVDLARSFVFGGSFGGTSGRTTSIDPGPGAAWTTLALSAPGELVLRRGISTGTTVAPWSVITLE